jgi:hypothetical protein
LRWELNQLDDFGTRLAVLSTVVSSLALIGVATSLFLQLRQLRASQAQTDRLMQIEIIKLVIDNPEFVAATDAVTGPESARLGAYINYQFSFLRHSFLARTSTEKAIRWQLKRQFSLDFRCTWWAGAREIYQADASNRRGRHFLAIAEEEYQGAIDRGNAVSKPAGGGRTGGI